MHRRSLGWGLSVVLVLLAGCNGGDDDGPSDSSSSSTTELSSTTTEPSTSTTLSHEDSLRLRVVELLGIRDELLMNPDPSRLAEWVLPACPCHEAVLGLQLEFVANGQRADGPDAEILGVEFTDETNPRFPIFTVVWQLREVHVLNAAGNVVRTRSASERRGVSVTLEQIEGRWLVHDLFEGALTPARIAEVMAAGLP